MHESTNQPELLLGQLTTAKRPHKTTTPKLDNKGQTTGGLRAIYVLVTFC